MKIQYCSDLHLEIPENKRFLDKHPVKPLGEVLLLGGDILPILLHKRNTSFIDFVATNFEIVYWVPGNHEYYGYDLGSVSDPLLENIRSNVWLVNNHVLEYKKVKFICSTLWTKINPANEWNIQQNVSDFSAIRWQGKKLSCAQFNMLHDSCYSFLQSAIEENVGQRSIVVTHHVPTLYNYPAQYRNNSLNEAFAVELYDFIYDSGAAYWIFGHHHTNIPAFSIGNTMMFTNQLGYVQQNEHLEFKANAFFEI